MSVNDKMKAIADAIRAHTGGTDALTLDAMAQAIAGIQAGGGGGLLWDRAYVTGSFMVAENVTDSYTINVPKTSDFNPTHPEDFLFVVFRLCPTVQQGIIAALNMPHKKNATTRYTTTVALSSTTNMGTTVTATITNEKTDDGFAITMTNSDSKASWVLQAGEEYVWLAVRNYL